MNARIKKLEEQKKEERFRDQVKVFVSKQLDEMAIKTESDGPMVERLRQLGRLKEIKEVQYGEMAKLVEPRVSHTEIVQ